MPAADQVKAFLEHHLDELSATLDLSRFWREDTDGQKEVLRRLLKLAPTLTRRAHHLQAVPSLRQPLVSGENGG